MNQINKLWDIFTAIHFAIKFKTLLIFIYSSAAIAVNFMLFINIFRGVYQGGCWSLQIAFSSLICEVWGLHTRVHFLYTQNLMFRQFWQFFTTVLYTSKTNILFIIYWTVLKLKINVLTSVFANSFCFVFFILKPYGFSCWLVLNG